MHVRKCPSAELLRLSATVQTQDDSLGPSPSRRGCPAVRLSPRTPRARLYSGLGCVWPLPRGERLPGLIHAEGPALLLPTAAVGMDAVVGGAAPDAFPARGITPTPVERLSGSGAEDELEVSEEASRLLGVQMAPRVVASCLWPQSLLFPPGAEGSDQGSKRGSDRGSELWLSSGHWRGPSPFSGLRGEPPGGLVDGVGELASGSPVSHRRLLGEGVQPGGKAPRRDCSLESKPTALSTAPGRPPLPRPQSPRQRPSKGRACVSVRSA